jgi:CDP-diacylglycerol--glycerol-3-phosphate 3-phosphatidyltransferase
MISEAIGVGGRRVIGAIVRPLARSRINPNALTFTGLLINIGCGVLYGYGKFFAAGLLMIFANFFDMLDGEVARLRGRVTRFGAFFDWLSTGIRMSSSTSVSWSFTRGGHLLTRRCWWP